MRVYVAKSDLATNQGVVGSNPAGHVYVDYIRVKPLLRHRGEVSSNLTVLFVALQCM